MMNNLLNPIGSLSMSAAMDIADEIVSEQPKNNQQTTSGESFLGKGGKVRHRGDFSDDNPYLDYLRAASSNEDIDALYERSVEWEADYANLQEQREYNRGVLEEQREYDSPVNQIARARAAGINPDLQGSSGGTSSGSGAQMQIPQMADQTGQTKFSNAYDNAAIGFQAVNTAANLVSSFGSAFGTIVDGIKKIKTLAPEMNLMNAQANFANAQANLANSQNPLAGAQSNQIQTLLKGKEDYQALTNNQLRLDNATKVFTQLIGMREFLTPDSDITPILTAMGISDAKEVDAYKKGFTELMGTPAVKAGHNQNLVALKESEADLAVYTSDYFGRVVQKMGKINEMQLDFQLDKQSLANAVQKSLTEDDNYAKNVANLDKVSVSNALESAKQSRREIDRYVNTYAKRIQYIGEQCREMRAKAAEIKQNATSLQRQMTAYERAEYDEINDTVVYLETLGANELSQFLSIAHDYNRKRFIVNAAGGYGVSGTPEDVNGNTSIINYSDIYFSDIINGAVTGSDLATTWTSIALNAVENAASVVTSGINARSFMKMAGKQMTGKTIKNFNSAGILIGTR